MGKDSYILTEEEIYDSKMTPTEKLVYTDDDAVFDAITSKEHAKHDSKDREKILNTYCHIVIFLILVFGLLSIFITLPYALHAGVCFLAYRRFNKLYNGQKRKTLFWSTRLRRGEHLLAIMACPEYKNYYCDFRERMRERIKSFNV